MIKAIVYTSNAGHTEKYAKMLEEETGIKSYSLNEKISGLEPNDEILYMGWLMAGTIKGLKKARKLYKINSVCGVGMAEETREQDEDVKIKNDLTEKYFYLQGGMEIKKLHGLYGFMIKSMSTVVKKGLEGKKDKTDADMKVLEMMTTGKDYTCKENLREVIYYLKK